MNDADDATRSQGQEPSMEDILSSIRRILSEDGAASGDDGDDEVRAGVTSSAAANVNPERTELVDTPHSPAPPDPPPARSRPAMKAREDYALAESDEAVLAPNNVFHLTPDMRLPPERQVLSQATSAASSDVLSQLAKAILDRRDIGIGGRDMTIEGLVREMLRPLLKEWLDRNLPYLIERLVKKEIDLMVNRAERLED
jgi:cell pole-organizing protein PopZ